MDDVGPEDVKRVTMDFDSIVLCSVMSAFAGWVTQLIFAIARLPLHERVYRSNGSDTAFTKAIQAMEPHIAYAQSYEVHRGKLVPAGVVVGRRASFLALVSRTEGVYHGQVLHAARVLRWRWLPPLLPDTSFGSYHPKGSITVMRMSSASIANAEWKARVEVACPGVVPQRAAREARAMASRLAAVTRASPTSVARIVLTGPPGCGKSTAARLLAEELGYTLCPAFDPTRPGQTLDGLLDTVLTCTRNASDGVHRTVIVVEEFDQCLMRIGGGTGEGACRDAAGERGALVDSAAHGARTEVTDKASWTSMMDSLQFVPGVVLILTTNLSLAELDAIDARHGGALLRPGRVTERIQWERGASRPRTSGKENTEKGE